MQGFGPEETWLRKCPHPFAVRFANSGARVVFIETLGECIKGSVLYLAADSLADNGLAGFLCIIFTDSVSVLWIRYNRQKFLIVNSPRNNSFVIFL